MYILFINLVGRCYIFFFLLNLIIIVIKKIVQPDPTQPMWVGLGWTYVMSWVGVEFFLTHHGELGQKNPFNPTYAHF